MEKYRGFTLAEVLITLSIIGIVAAMTLPMLITNINERIYSERHANIAQKVTKAMEQMRAHGLLNTQYTTTEAFVDELQKYLKITKRCDKDHIADCWPTENVFDKEGNETKISDIKTGKNLNLETETNNVGLVLTDGAPLILNYNPNIGTIDVGDAVKVNTVELPVGNGKKKEFHYTTSVTDSIDFVTDVNGKKAPNKDTIDNIMHDIRSLRIASFHTCGGMAKEIDDICIIDLGNAKKIGANHWEGAKAMCEEIGYYLPEASELQSIYYKIPDYFTEGRWYWTKTDYNNIWAYVISIGADNHPKGQIYNAGNKDMWHKVMCAKKF